MLMLQHQDGSRACDFPFLIEVACLFTSVLDTDVVGNLFSCSTIHPPGQD
jgi:hypothetical protein